MGYLVCFAKGVCWNFLETSRVIRCSHGTMDSRGRHRDPRHPRHELGPKLHGTFPAESLEIMIYLQRSLSTAFNAPWGIVIFLLTYKKKDGCIYKVRCCLYCIGVVVVVVVAGGGGVVVVVVVTQTTQFGEIMSETTKYKLRKNLRYFDF